MRLQLRYLLVNSRLTYGLSLRVAPNVKKRNIYTRIKLITGVREDISFYFGSLIGKHQGMLLPTS